MSVSLCKVCVPYFCCSSFLVGLILAAQCLITGSTDAARAAADIVLTQPGLSTIVHGILIARKIFARIRNFLVYRIAATLQLLVFFFVAVFALKPIDFQPSNYESISNFPDDFDWPLFFHMPVIMLMLITLLNDGTLIAIGYDIVVPGQNPERWNLPVLFLISSVMAGIAFISSIVLLYCSLNSWNEGSVFQTWGLGGISYGQVTTSIYLKVSISDFLTLFSCRTGDQFWWTTRPSWILLGAGGFALMCSTVLAIAWPASTIDGVYAEGLGRNQPYGLFFFIWLYCIFWWFIQDFFKVLTYRILEKYNFFNYNDTGKLVLPDSTLAYIRDHKDADMRAAMNPGAKH